MSIFKNPNYKGSYEYLAARRRQYIAYAALCALLVIGFFLLGWFLTHSRRNLFILPALMCVIPFANFVAAYIAMSSGAVYLSSEKRALVQRFEDTAVKLAQMFENDREAAVKTLLDEHFNKYDFRLDYAAQILGKEAVKNAAQQIYDALSETRKQQVIQYLNGEKSVAWTLNRSNLRFIIDNRLVDLQM